MAKFRRSNPGFVSAVQWTGENFEEVVAHAGVDNIIAPHHPARLSLWAAAWDAWMPVDFGEWILRDVSGCCAMADAMFRVIYEPVE